MNEGTFLLFHYLLYLNSLEALIGDGGAYFALLKKVMLVK